MGNPSGEAREVAVRERRIDKEKEIATKVSAVVREVS